MSVQAMPTRDKGSAGRLTPVGISPVGAAQHRSPNKTQFTALSDAQWQAILPTRNHWPSGIDWRREIERIGRDYWEARAIREMWVKKMQGKKPSKQLQKVQAALESAQNLQKELTELVNDHVLDDDLPKPNLETAEQRLEAWLADYDVWVRPFAGKNNPIQAHLEWQLMRLWRKSGGKLVYSRKKDKRPPAQTSRGSASWLNRTDPMHR
jgi:hypothetical protein